MSRSNQENESILDRIRDWVARTQDEMNALDPCLDNETNETGPIEDDPRLRSFSEFVWNPVACSEHITRFDEAIQSEDPAGGRSMEDPGDRNRAAAIQIDSTEDGFATRLPEIGLREFVETFTAMRHELKLQTRSARVLKEAVQASLDGLEAAMNRMESAQPRAEEAAERAVIPFMESLVALDEALLRSVQTFESSSSRIVQDTRKRVMDTLEETFQGIPRWRRWMVRHWLRQAGQVCHDIVERSLQDEFDRLIVGNAMVRERIEQALRAHGIHRMQCIGRQVDPAEMTVVELVDSPESAPETVVSEVRTGYKWKDRIIRYAEVSVAGSGRERQSNPEGKNDDQPNHACHPAARLHIH